MGWAWEETRSHRCVRSDLSSLIRDELTQNRFVLDSRDLMSTSQLPHLHETKFQATLCIASKAWNIEIMRNFQQFWLITTSNDELWAVEEREGRLFTDFETFGGWETDNYFTNGQKSAPKGCRKPVVCCVERNLSLIRSITTAMLSQLACRAVYMPYQNIHASINSEKDSSNTSYHQLPFSLQNAASAANECQIWLQWVGILHASQEFIRDHKESALLRKFINFISMYSLLKRSILGYLYLLEVEYNWTSNTWLF